MKKSVLIIAIISLTINLNAQSKKLKEKIENKTEYVAKAMNLNETQRTFLYNTMLNNAYKANQKKKNLTKEQKKEINKEARKELKTKLAEKFTKEEINQIFALLKEKRELDKNNTKETKQ